MAKEIQDAYVVSCRRTPVGRIRGVYKNTRPDDLLVHCIKGVLKEVPGMDPALIQAIDPRWNHYNTVHDDTRLIHFSHVREQPWKRPEHPMTALWKEWLREAMSAGYVGRGDILRAVSRGRIHPHFLRHVLKAA